MSDAILDPFHRELAAVLSERLEERKNSLAMGSARRSNGTDTVGERYAEEVGYILALVDVLNVAGEIERRQMSAGTRSAPVNYG